jgi:polyisoprenoid-binding protein YceI
MGSAEARSWIAFLAAFLLAESAQAKPARYLLDAQASSVVVRVGKAGVFGFAGHEHEVVGGSFEGTVVADREDIARSSVEVRFDTAGLRVTGKGEPKKDVPKVQKAMVGPKCLDVTRYPHIRFVSKTVAGKHTQDRYDLEIRGDLTVHGVTRALSFPVRVDIAGDRLTANGHTVIRQTDFGITPISTAGVVKVKDELALEWTLVARRSP